MENKFSRISRERLDSADERLQRLFEAVLQRRDIAIAEGHRTVTRQQKLYAQGRTTPGKRVTWVDGIKKKSKHNSVPSLAIDYIPWPEKWDSVSAFEKVDKIIKEEAKRLGINIRCGSDWNKKDRPHVELRI